LSITKSPITKPLVVLPVYNEISSIKTVLDSILRQKPEIEVLVVDDSSPDGTSEEVKNHKEFGHKIHLLERPEKKGLGSAYKDGFQWALRKNYDACIEMDADLSHDPDDIPRLIEGLNSGADLAIGSRYLGGVRVLNWPLARLLLSTFAGLYTRVITGLPLSDPTSGFKAIRRQVLEKLDWGKFIADGYGFQIELHFFSWQLGCAIQELPIIFTERRDGQSKMSNKIALEAAIRVITLAMTRMLGRKK